MPNGGGPLGFPEYIKLGDCVAIAAYNENTQDTFLRMGRLLAFSEQGGGYFRVTLERAILVNDQIDFTSTTYRNVYEVEEL